MYGEDLPEIRNWKWGAISAGKPAQKRAGAREDGHDANDPN